jgi:germination protein M
MATKAKRKSSASKKTAVTSRNLIPLYVLAIMGLSAALVVVLNFKNNDIGTSKKSQKTEQNSQAVETITKPQQDSNEKIPAKDNSEPVKDLKVKAKIFFLVYDEKSGKIFPGSVQREIQEKDNVEDALKELAKGPTTPEEKKGLITALPRSLKIRKVDVKNGIADIDLSRDFEEDANGDIATGRVNQIFYTATQFAGVRGIVLRVNGKQIKTLGGEGLILSWPMKKPL